MNEQTRLRMRCSRTVSAPYRPDFVEVDALRGQSRLHGRCPHCEDVVIVTMPRATVVCSSCEHPFELLEILPLTKLTL